MRSELFEETIKQHKDSLTDELVQLGKHRQAQLAEWDIEQNETDYEFYFDSAWNYQQSKVNELQNNINLLNEALDIKEQLNQKLREREDELQKRVDAVKQLIEDLNKCYQQDHQNKFEYWRGFADSAGILGKRLEQALKGGNHEAN